MMKVLDFFLIFWVLYFVSFKILSCYFV